MLTYIPIGTALSGASYLEVNVKYIGRIIILLLLFGSIIFRNHATTINKMDLLPVTASTDSISLGESDASLHFELK